MKRLFALMIKEFRQLSRDSLTLRMIIMVPLMQTFLFGYAINFDVKHLKMVVLDESRSYDSRELVAKMAISEYFEVIGAVNSFGELQRALDTATASVGLVIDADYGKDRHRGAPAKAMLVVNASRRPGSGWVWRDRAGWLGRRPSGTARTVASTSGHGAGRWRCSTPASSTRPPARGGGWPRRYSPRETGPRR